MTAEPLIAAVPSGHALARQRNRAEDLASEPFIMYAPYEARYFHDLLVELFSRARLVPNYVQHLAQIHSILAMVHSGVGVALVPEAAMNLHFSGVALRPVQCRGRGPPNCSLSGAGTTTTRSFPSLPASPKGSQLRPDRSNQWIARYSDWSRSGAILL